MRYWDNSSVEYTISGDGQGNLQWDGRDDRPVSERVEVTFTGEFVTQRKTRVDGDVVCRLSVRAGDDLVDVVLPPAAHGDSFDLLTGARYTVGGWVARAPSARSRAGDAEGVDGEGGRTAGDTDDVLAIAVDPLGVDDWFVVCDEMWRRDRRASPEDEREADGQSTGRDLEALEEFLSVTETVTVDR